MSDPIAKAEKSRVKDLKQGKDAHLPPRKRGRKKHIDKPYQVWVRDKFMFLTNREPGKYYFEQAFPSRREAQRFIEKCARTFSAWRGGVCAYDEQIAKYEIREIHNDD